MNKNKIILDGIIQSSQRNTYSFKMGTVDTLQKVKERVKQSLGKLGFEVENEGR
jgi:hypothetical protein